MRQRDLGTWGEALAAEHLLRQGWTVLARGWRQGRGEIDLIADDGSEVVFVEVKTRAGGSLGSPEEAVTPRKQRQLRSLAELFLQAHPELEGRPFRIDVVAVEKDGSKVTLRHYRSAV